LDQDSKTTMLEFLAEVARHGGDDPPSPHLEALIEGLGANIEVIDIKVGPLFTFLIVSLILMADFVGSPAAFRPVMWSEGHFQCICHYAARCGRGPGEFPSLLLC